MKLFVCYGTGVLVIDDGDVISGSNEITDWAAGYHAPAGVGAAG